jgi:hypothetical protein
MREAKHEDALHTRIEVLDGEWRRVKWIGRSNAPDDYIMLRPYAYTDRHGNRHQHPGYVGWVELKASKKGPRPAQVREHNRMRNLGAQVLVINSFELIDKYFPTTERPL